jgi:hypothetical protein
MRLQSNILYLLYSTYLITGALLALPRKTDCFKRPH